ARAPQACLLSVATRLSCFTFVGSVYDRDLHSFPTRRSSDLYDFTGPPPSPLAEFSTSVEVDDAPLTAEVNTILGASNVPLPSNTDRKSTRLNSSHVSISYAVFCLKKQKTTPPSPTWPQAKHH